jgi:hypothetical protein
MAIEARTRRTNPRGEQVPDRPVYTVIVQPTIAQDCDDWHRARWGKPAPGMPPHLLGYAWTVRDVVHMRDRARGLAPTAEQAKAAGQAAARGDPEPARELDQELPEDWDRDVELVRRGVGVFDQDREQ